MWIAAKGIVCFGTRVACVYALARKVHAWMESLCRHDYLNCSRAIVGGYRAESILCMLDVFCGESFIGTCHALRRAYDA